MIFGKNAEDRIVVRNLVMKITGNEKSFTVIGKYKVVLFLGSLGFLGFCGCVRKKDRKKT